jgi:predicted transcriptional regulator
VDAAETRAWIFLSVPEQSGLIADIIAMADGINHAIPTQDELRQSLRWLQKRGLVCRDGRRHRLTDLGITLRRSTSASNIFKTWDIVADRFRRDDKNI